MRLAVLLVLAVACSSHSDQPNPNPTPTPTPSATPNPNPTPTPIPEGPMPKGVDCTTAADCATTTYALEPVKEASGCCAALACARVDTKKHADELAAAWSSTCAAVRCRAPDCPAGAPEPTPVCNGGHCMPR